MIENIPTPIIIIWSVAIGIVTLVLSGIIVLKSIEIVDKIGQRISDRRDMGCDDREEQRERLLNKRCVGYMGLVFGHRILPMLYEKTPRKNNGEKDCKEEFITMCKRCGKEF